MTPDEIADRLRASRRSFLGWTLAVAGSSLFTRPALALPDGARLVRRVDIPLLGHDGLGMRRVMFAEPLRVLADELFSVGLCPNARGEVDVLVYRRGDPDSPVRELSLKVDVQ